MSEFLRIIVLFMKLSNINKLIVSVLQGIYPKGNFMNTCDSETFLFI